MRRRHTTTDAACRLVHSIVRGMPPRPATKNPHSVKSIA
ncbi:hypothetical protein A3768_5250 (plasmid) [Ralstonia solanacearum]|nr:hypothetical protein F504_4134 [Ralstonia pseudosolanacearum FQY_4]ANH36040.1 hypothetical protein A3768_5250 [Ralstonia solanacearum]